MEKKRESSSSSSLYIGQARLLLILWGVSQEWGEFVVLPRARYHLSMTVHRES